MEINLLKQTVSTLSANEEGIEMKQLDEKVDKLKLKLRIALLPERRIADEEVSESDV